MYKRILAAGAIVAIGLMGCAKHKPVKNSNSVYISGEIKGENFSPGITSDTYRMTINPGLYNFTVEGQDAAKMDALLDPKDRVKLLVRKWERSGKNGYRIGLHNLVELNGVAYTR